MVFIHDHWLASVRIHRAAQEWTRTWYAVGMAPTWPVLTRSQIAHCCVPPFPSDAALLQPHLVHSVGFVFVPTHSRAICSWNSSAVFGSHGQTHTLGAVDRFDSSWIAGLPLPTPLRSETLIPSRWVRAANRVVASLEEELRTAAAGLDS